MVEENARTLVIRTFQSKKWRLGDSAGLELVLATWLGLARPTLGAVGRRYTIRCATSKDAKLVVDWLGGTQKGRVVTGYTVDLTT